MKKIFYIILLLTASCYNINKAEKSLQLALQSDSLITANKLDEAEKVINEAIELDKYNYIAYNNLGVLRNKKGYPNDQVLECLIRSVTINPGYEIGVFSLANFYHEIKDHPNAKIYCTNYLAINSGESRTQIAHIYVIRAEANIAENLFIEALQDTDSSIVLDPNSSGAFKERGSALRQLKQYDEAIENYLKALEINPDYHQAYNGLGLCYDQGKIDISLAIQCYTKAINLSPESGTYFYNRGTCFYENGLKDKALTDLKKADSLGKPEAKGYMEKHYR